MREMLSVFFPGVTFLTGVSLSLSSSFFFFERETVARSRPLVRVLDADIPNPAHSFPPVLWEECLRLDDRRRRRVTH